MHGHYNVEPVTAQDAADAINAGIGIVVATKSIFSVVNAYEGQGKLHP
jgi:hypothetical protein